MSPRRCWSPTSNSTLAEMLKQLFFGALGLAASVAAVDCPGYKAQNVKVSSNGLTANLKLAGAPCNSYGKDLDDLVLKVEYQTGM